MAGNGKEEAILSGSPSLTQQDEHLENGQVGSLGKGMATPRGQMSDIPDVMVKKPKGQSPKLSAANPWDEKGNKFFGEVGGCSPKHKEVLILS